MDSDSDVDSDLKDSVLDSDSAYWDSRTRSESLLESSKSVDTPFAPLNVRPHATLVETRWVNCSGRCSYYL